MSKKRVEWRVRLEPSNLSPIKEELMPKVILTRTWTLEEVITRISTNYACPVHIETLRFAASMLMDEMKECLIEGGAVSTPLGTFTPSVTGTWSTNRIMPEERERNAATVRYSPSGQLKKALANPLFHETSGTGLRLSIYSVTDSATHLENQRLTPGRVATLKGNRLLMNGDLPQRGLYLLDAETGAEACHISPEEMVLNTRGRILFQVPNDLPPGRYCLKVVSQCTTSPRPMKHADEYTLPTVLTAIPYGEESEGEAIGRESAATGREGEAE